MKGCAIVLAVVFGLIALVPFCATMEQASKAQPQRRWSDTDEHRFMVLCGGNEAQCKCQLPQFEQMFTAKDYFTKEPTEAERVKVAKIVQACQNGRLTATELMIHH